MNKEQLNKYIVLSFTIICLISFLLISLSIVPVSKLLGESEIILHLNWYLNESQKFERENLLTLLYIETLLSPMQHSYIDISSIIDSKIGIGEILASLNQLISDSSKMYIFTISAIGIMKYIIIINEFVMPYLFGGLLFAGTLFGLCHSFSDSYGLHIILCNKVIKILFILFLISHILLPYSLFSSIILSDSIIKKDKIENRTKLQNLYNQIKIIQKKESLTKRAEKSIYSLEKTVLDLPHKIELIIIHFTRHIAMSILEFIVLPIVLFLISVSMLRWIIKIEDI